MSLLSEENEFLFDLNEIPEKTVYSDDGDEFLFDLNKIPPREETVNSSDEDFAVKSAEGYTDHLHRRNQATKRKKKLRKRPKGLRMDTDPYQELRMDTDHMTYEQLLQLCNNMGYENSGVKASNIDRCLRNTKPSEFQSLADKICCICQVKVQIESFRKIIIEMRCVHILTVN
ncbi:RING/U-box superfamily protein [Arabidopsis thaliana]|uniref:RING-type E3 ubiquitin transferase n=1 Tax=Arabidopsis thaliana TaxID=3702 RepID=A0A1P8B8C9_ARATH|nr:RING/U-box superfamily protein [Arabidopsis thaliana]ANM67847.1 RING/U-box superfamily protein [Arabidopsis thaliana]|eukprot:NP_001329648.1 RING/U-box superfamily protein [Arabidopsis thaliana]